MVAVEQVKPTRMELLNIKEKIKLSEKGHKLLKQKRDVLILEFFAIFEKARDIRSELNAQMAKAFTSLAIAQAYHGIFEIESASLAVKKAPGVRVTVRNVMGVKIPKVESSYVKKGLMDRGYGLLGSSAKIDEAAESFEGALDTIIKLSETETALKRLIEETEKTKRRVNALEYVILPRFKEQAKYINMRLDEMERETFSTLKHIKKKFQRG
ncbi:MAG: V-type ATP synthase subunit D [Candidatus Micrarchaeota archaeon]|nr:V-type ATP synthase subunit D [Candidatus Micrarchaeota archaeon]